MASPRVFISSTYYDLKHLRSALDTFIAGLGYEGMLSEKGDIAYAPDAPLDESCYRTTQHADIFVLIIGGRYGSAASSEGGEFPDGFFDRYDSITKKEYEAAVSANVPAYILIERAVYAEYQTFRKNRNKIDIKYAHVDSINIFRLIDEILAQPRNNPLFQFDRYQEIEVWLRNQWAGLFKDLLGSLSERERLTSLSSQVSQLAESNKTFRRYLEEVMSTVSPDKSEKLIDQESKRLKESEILHHLSENEFVHFLSKQSPLSIEEIREVITKSESFSEIYTSLEKKLDNDLKKVFQRIIDGKEDYALRDINDARGLIGLKKISWGTR